MTKLSPFSKEKLALSKEMFAIGLYHSKKNTRTGRMLAILNFDFAVTTILVTCCIDNRLNPKKKNGRSKEWSELTHLFKRFL